MKFRGSGPRVGQYRHIVKMFWFNYIFFWLYQLWEIMSCIGIMFIMSWGENLKFAMGQKLRLFMGVGGNKYSQILNIWTRILLRVMAVFNFLLKTTWLIVTWQYCINYIFCFKTSTLISCVLCTAKILGFFVCIIDGTVKFIKDWQLKPCMSLISKS